MVCPSLSSGILGSVSSSATPHCSRCSHARPDFGGLSNQFLSPRGILTEGACRRPDSGASVVP